MANTINTTGGSFADMSRFTELRQRLFFLIGALIVEKALSSPIKRIASNAGENGAIIAESIKDSSFEIGYNAATNEFVDMYEAGMIDPTKVTGSTLQNAASIASMILTTECMVVNKPKEEVVNG